MSSIWTNVGLFFLAAGIIATVGPRLSRVAERVGNIFGISQTLAGALLLGASTSLPGLVVSTQTALNGRATLALGNSVGGIAAQTLFIALADVALRSDTLQHQDTLSASLMQSAVLISLLGLVLLSMSKPAFTVWNVHVLSPVIAIAVLLGFRMIQEMRQRPQWLTNESQGAVETESDSGSAGAERQSNRNDSQQSERQSQGGTQSKWRTVGKYVLYLSLVGFSGWLISTSGNGIVSQTGLSPVLMGATGMAIATSLPELVTAIAAVRRGSVGLAIGDIVGGNAFDTVMIAVADFAYPGESIFEGTSDDITFLTTVALVMTGVLLIGFLRRDQKGLANIGVESYLVALLYLAGTLVIVFR